MTNVWKTLTFIGTLSFAMTANAAPFDDFKFATPERFDMSFELGYLKPDSNFDKSGNTYTKVPSGNSYQLTTFDLSARTRLAPRWHVYGNAEFASAASTSVLTGVPVDKSNTGPTHALIGTDFVAMTGGIMLIPDFSVSFPLAENDRTGLAINEGVTEVVARLVARLERRNHRLGFFAGVDYRDKGRPMLAPYGILGELTFGTWNLGTDLRGYQTLVNDKDTSSEVTYDTTYFCLSNGCFKKFGAFNPSVMTSDTWVRWNSTPNFAAYASFSGEVAGSNTAKGIEGMLGFIYRFGTVSTARTSEFQEFTDDGVDQRPFQNSGSRSMTPSVVRPQGPARPTLKDELNKTEMQIDTKPATNENP